LFIYFQRHVYSRARQVLRLCAALLAKPDPVPPITYSLIGIILNVGCRYFIYLLFYLFIYYRFYKETQLPNKNHSSEADKDIKQFANPCQDLLLEPTYIKVNDATGKVTMDVNKYK
jgi:hypothetical protein